MWRLIRDWIARNLGPECAYSELAAEMVKRAAEDHAREIWPDTSDADMRGWG